MTTQRQRYSGSFGSSGYGTGSTLTSSRHYDSVGSIKTTPSSHFSRETPVMAAHRSRLGARGADRLGETAPSGSGRYQHGIAAEPPGISRVGSRTASSSSSTSSGSGSVRTPAAGPGSVSSAARFTSGSGYLARSRNGPGGALVPSRPLASSGYVPSTGPPTRRESLDSRADAPASPALRRTAGVAAHTAAPVSAAALRDRAGAVYDSSSSSSSDSDSPVRPTSRAANISAQFSDLSMRSKGDSLTRALSGSRRSSLDWASELGSGAKGLANLGNTCFMNSILQCLAATPELMREFARPGGLLAGSAGPVASAFSEVMRSLWGSGGGSVTPRKFLDQVTRRDRRWSGGRQHDSLEFLQFLLGALVADTNRVKGKPKYQELSGKGTEEQQAQEAWDYAKKREDSAVNDIFGGMLQSVVTCSVCQHRSHCFDPILDLSIPISGRNCSVTDCLASFTEVERMGKGDGYRCEKCKCAVPCTKQLVVYTAPKVLIIHLKRFSSSLGGFGRFSSLSKNTSAVRLVTNGLDLSPYCNPNGIKALRGCTTYDLIGVSNHSGSLGGGHYTALCQNFRDRKWYDFNDSHASVSQISESASQSAYVLFYRRRD